MSAIYQLAITLSDVDRGVYEALDLRLALHPSESLRYLVTRALAYALSYEEGIAFSKGGLSSSEEPAVLVRDLTGVLKAWIEVGVPSAERIHRASKAAEKVLVYTSSEPTLLMRDAANIYQAEAIEVWKLEPAFLAALEAELSRKVSFELTRNEGRLYVAIGGKSFESAIERRPLVGKGDV